MSNSLTVYDNFETAQQAGMVLYKSGYFADAKSEAQAIVKVMAGAELGLPPFASMAGIHIVNGKPTIGANVIATLVKNDPRYDYRVKVANDAECVLTWYEHGKAVGEAGFTIKEAQAAGLTSKDTWKKYASDMLFARAISRGARRYAPGIFGGSPVYTPDEMGVDTDEDGYIEGVVVEVTPAPAKAAEPADAPELFGEDVIQYGDGSVVTERAMQYYDLYVGEVGDAPENYDALAAWYKARAKAQATQPALVPAQGGVAAYAE